MLNLQASGEAKLADTTPPEGSYEISVLPSETSDGETNDKLEEAAPRIDLPGTEEQESMGLGPQMTTSASGTR